MSRFKKEIRALWDSIGWYRQKLKSAENCFITCSGKTDGPGAQIQAVLSTMLFANELGIKYVHTPFKKMDRRPGDGEVFESRWESLANLGLNETPVDHLDLNEIEVVRVAHPREVKKIKDTLYIISHCHKFADRNPDLYLKMQDEFCHKFFSSAEQVELCFDDSKLNIAVHVRRGEITCKHLSRYTPDDLILRLMKGIGSAAISLGEEPVFHIYSEGRIEEFSSFDHSGVVFHLDECPFATFCQMASADVLVTAKSSFSYSAALFSKGIIIYEPFWHKPLRNWVVVNKNGSFDKRRFKDMIKQRATRK